MHPHRLIIPLLVLITLPAFWRAASCRFVNYDDSLYTFANPYVLNGLNAADIHWAFTTDTMGYYHPLTLLSLMFDSTVWGDGPQGYHITNILLHVLAVVLLYLALNALTAAPWRSGLVSILFAVHPLRVESVAWISERKDVLSGCFFFATLLAYAAYTHRPNGRRYALVLVLFILGLMSKPIVVTLPFLLLLLDVWPLRRLPSPVLPAPSARCLPCPGRSASVLVLEKIPFLILSAACSLIAYFMQIKAGGIVDRAKLPVALRLTNIPVSYVRYLIKMVWFRGLIVVYPFKAWPDWEVAGAAALLLLVTAVVIVRFRPNPWLAIGWFWYLGLLVPVIGLGTVGYQAMADRFLYLPAGGLLIMVVWSLPDRLFQTTTGQLGLGAATLAITAVLALFSWWQIAYWQDSVTLFTHALQFEPNQELILTDIGLALDLEQNDPRGALVYLRQAATIAPDSADAQFNFGSLLDRLGQKQEAWGHLRRAMDLKPDSAIAHYIRGVAFMRENRPDQASRQFQQAIAINPDFAAAYRDMGNVLMFEHRVAEALARYQQALRVDGNDPENYFAVAKALANLGRFRQALTCLQQVMLLRPNLAKAYAYSGQILMQLNRREEGMASLRKAVELDPANAEFRAMLARAISQGPLQIGAPGLSRGLVGGPP